MIGLFAQIDAAKPVAPLPPPLRKAEPPHWFDVAVPYLWLGGVLLAMAVALRWYQKKLASEKDALSANDLLSEAREWEEEGELTQEEFQKLKSNLTPRIKTGGEGRKNQGDPAKRPPRENP